MALAEIVRQSVRGSECFDKGR